MSARVVPVAEVARASMVRIVTFVCAKRVELGKTVKVDGIILYLYL